MMIEYLANVVGILNGLCAAWLAVIGAGALGALVIWNEYGWRPKVWQCILLGIPTLIAILGLIILPSKELLLANTRPAETKRHEMSRKQHLLELLDNARMVKTASKKCYILQSENHHILVCKTKEK